MNKINFKLTIITVNFMAIHAFYLNGLNFKKLSYNNIDQYALTSSFTNKFLIKNISQPGLIRNKFNCLFQCSVVDECMSIYFDSTNTICLLFKEKPMLSTDIAPSVDTNIYLKLYKSSYNMTCQRDADCRMNAGLICLNNKCKCAGTNQIWSHQSLKCEQCDNGWSAFEERQECYKYFDLSVGWNQANSGCISQNKSLLVVNDDVKFNFYQNVILTSGYTSWIWIGSNTNTPMVYTWPDGSAVSSSYFVNGDPNNGGNYNGALIEGCLLYWPGVPGTQVYYLADGNCDTAGAYFCFYKL